MVFFFVYKWKLSMLMWNAYPSMRKLMHADSIAILTSDSNLIPADTIALRLHWSSSYCDRVDHSSFDSPSCPYSLNPLDAKQKKRMKTMVFFLNVNKQCA